MSEQVFSIFSNLHFGVKTVYNYGLFLCICNSAYRKSYLEGSVNNFDLIEIHLDVKNPRIQSDWKDICRKKSK